MWACTNGVSYPLPTAEPAFALERPLRMPLATAYEIGRTLQIAVMLSPDTFGTSKTCTRLYIRTLLVHVGAGDFHHRSPCGHVAGNCHASDT
jgi:hypothetical protein